LSLYRSCTQPFGTILDLVPLAESVVKLKAVCMLCFKDAAFTKRLGSEKEIEVIGGTDKYMAVCRTCYTMPDRKALVRSEHTPTRGGGDTTLGRQLFPDDH
jgi:thymidine kinase